MCHYAQLTVPKPAVIETIVFAPLVVDDEVKPAETVMVLPAVGKLKITIPLPPLPPLRPPPPPLPVFALPVAPPVPEPPAA
jgi:hypothetical protein